MADEQVVKSNDPVTGGDVAVAEAQNNLPTGVTGTIDGGAVTTAGADADTEGRKVGVGENRAPLPSEVRDVELRYGLTTPEAERVYRESGGDSKKQQKIADEITSGRVINQQVYAQVPATDVAGTVPSVNPNVEYVDPETGDTLSDKEAQKRLDAGVPKSSAPEDGGK